MIINKYFFEKLNNTRFEIKDKYVLLINLFIKTKRPIGPF